ncbi:unnamed protein product [Closterium sp. NIES-64]|nr:unnamed protein product [Closterium sp. NIES-64]
MRNPHPILYSSVSAVPPSSPYPSIATLISSCSSLIVVPSSPHVSHPARQVMASQSKIYMVLELAAGGQLFDRIVHRGRLAESEARRYFQQLVDAVDCCHAKGVCHRDLKVSPSALLPPPQSAFSLGPFKRPENLLLDERGNLKVSDFGLSALPQQQHRDGLLHTTCGTPNYVAPEVRPSAPLPHRSTAPLPHCVLCEKGYDGRLADVWSCGVILFVLLAGYAPFQDSDLRPLYRKIRHALFSFPACVSPSARSLISAILQPDPAKRLTMEGIRQHVWFKPGYIPAQPSPEAPVHTCDIDSAFSHHHLLGLSAPTQPLSTARSSLPAPPPSQCGAELRITAVDSLPRSTSPPLPSPSSDASAAPSSSALSAGPCASLRLSAWGSEQGLGERGGKGAGSEGHGSEGGEGERAEGGGVKEGGAGASAAEESPELMNAFDLIARAHALNLGALFHRRADPVLRQTRFASRLPPALIRSRLLALAPALHVDAHAKLFKIRFCRPARNRGRELTVVIQIFEMTPGVFMVEARKDAGDALEYHKFYRALLARVTDMVCHDSTRTPHPSIAPPLATALAPTTLPSSPPDSTTCASAPSPGVFGKPGVLQEAKPGLPRDEAEQLIWPQQVQSAHRRASLDEGRIVTTQACGSFDGERGRRRSMDDASQAIADMVTREAAAAAGVAEAARRDEEAFKSPAKTRSLDFWPGSLMSSVLQSPLFKTRSSATASPSKRLCSPLRNDLPALSLTQLHSCSCSCSGPVCHCRAALSCSADRSGDGDGRGESGGDTDAVQLQEVM